MAAEPLDKRARLVEAAVECFHQRGFRSTTLADIARQADVPLGNVYYYFKTKDALAEAVFDRHRDRIESEFAQAGTHAAPAERVAALLELLASGADRYAKHGCPYGSLNLELGKGRGPMAKRARELLSLQLDWLSAQFRAMGQAKGEATDSAQAVLSLIQGAILVGYAFESAEIIRRRLRGLAKEVRAEAIS